MKRIAGLGMVMATALAVSGSASETGKELRGSALDAMKRAGTFFRTKVATHGGYLWRYSLDFKHREGEGVATPTQIWVQPPGTPTVGETFLDAYEATKDKYFLDGAVDAAHALVWGQLESGGWDYRIDFDPVKSKRWYLLRDVKAGDTDRGLRNDVTTFDDDNTQSALRLLIRVDRALKGQDQAVREAAEYGLSHLLMAQYPNGAWPQRYWGPHDASKFPVMKARYPKTWSRTFPNVGYGGFYTFNDGAIRDCVATLLAAYEAYGKPEYRAAAIKAADFVLLAEMPEPQPAWAQQYNPQMEPAWARKFEPPSVTGGESVSAMQILKMIYEITGDAKYLEPIPRALAWYKRSKLGDGTWARFYELRTNKPLYFTRGTYKLTYDDRDTPTHYCFKSKAFYPTSIERWYVRLMKVAPDQRAASAKAWAEKAKRSPGKVNEDQVRAIIKALDDQGRWRKGDWIDCGVFNQNMRTLARYVSQDKSE